MAEDAQWVSKQVKAYTAYFNDALIKSGATNAAGAPLQVVDLFEDLRDGTLLFPIIEGITGEKITQKYNKKPRLQFHRLENCNLAVSLMQARGMKTHGICGEDIEGKNQKAVMAWCWELIKTFSKSTEFRKPWQWADDFEKQREEKENAERLAEESKTKADADKQNKERWKKKEEELAKQQREQKAKADKDRLLKEEAERKKLSDDRLKGSGNKYGVVVGSNDDARALPTIRELVKSGQQVVVCLPNKETPLAAEIRRLGANVTVFEANPTDPLALHKVFQRGVNKAAFLPKEGNQMVDQAKAFAKAAKNSGVGHVVKAGTIGSKHNDEVDRTIDAAGVPRTSVNHAPLMTELSQSVDQGVATLPTKGAAIPWVNPDDLGLALSKALQEPSTKGKAYTITGPRALTGEQSVEVIADSLEEDDDISDPRAKKVKRRNKGGEMEVGGALDDDVASGGKASGDQAAGRSVDKTKQTESDLLAALNRRQRLHKFKECAPDEAKAYLSASLAPSNDFEALTGQKPKDLKDFAKGNKTAFDRPARVFVVGVDDSGPVGLEMVKELRSPEKNVPLLVGVKSLDSPIAHTLRKLGCEVAEVDPTKLASVGKAMTGCDKVVLLQEASPTLPQEVKTVLTAAKKLGTVQHIIRSSILGADQKNSPLASWNADADHLLDEGGIPDTIVRPAPTAGEFAGTVAPGLKSKGIGSTTLGEAAAAPWVHPSDVAHALATVVSNPTSSHHGKKYNITGPKVMRTKELADSISKATGFPLPLQTCSIDELRDQLVAEGMDADIATAKAKLFEQLNSNPLTDVSNDLENLTGSPPQPIESYATEHPDPFQPPEKVLVLSADNPIGMEAVKRMASEPDAPKVTAVVTSLQSPEAHALKSLPNVEVVQVDATKKVSLVPVMNGVSKVLLIQPESPDMVTVAKTVAEACKDAGVARLVRVGAMGSNDRNTPLSKAHDECEKAIEESGVPHVWVRSAPLMNTVEASAGYPDPEEPEGSLEGDDVGKPGGRGKFGGRESRGIYGNNRGNASGQPGGVPGQDGETDEGVPGGRPPQRRKPGPKGSKPNTDAPEGSPSPDDAGRPGSSHPHGPTRPGENPPPDELCQRPPPKPGVKFNPKGAVPVCLPMGDEAVAFVDPRDVALAASKALSKPDVYNQAFNITGPQELTGRAVAEMLGKATGLPVEYDPKTPSPQAPRKGDLPKGKTDDFEVLTGEKPGSFDAFVKSHPTPPNLQKPACVFVSNAECPLGLETVKRLSALKSGPIKAGVKSLDSPAAIELSKLPNVEPVALDPDFVKNPNKAPPLLKGVTKVAIVEDDTPELAEKTLALAKAAEAAGAKQVVVCGVIDSNCRRTAVAAWHDDAEKAIEKECPNLERTYIRHAPTFDDLLEPSSDSLKSKEHPTLFSPTNAAVAWVDNKDVAQAMCAALVKPEQNKKIYNVTGSEPMKASQVAKLLEDNTERPIETDDPQGPTKHKPPLRGGNPKEEEIRKAKMAQLADMQNDSACFPTNDLEKLTGQKPHSLREYIKDNADTIANFKSPLVLNADDPDGVGYEAVKQLSKQGKVIATVTSLKSIEADNLRKLGPNVELRQVDENREPELRAALEDVSKVVWIAPDTPEAAESAKRISKACKDSGVAKLVRVGNDHGDKRDNPLAVANSDAESVLEDSGVPCVLVRHGPLMSRLARDSAATLKDDNTLTLPTDGPLAVMDPSDVGEAAARAVQTAPAGQTYRLTGPVALTGQEIADIISDSVGAPIYFNPVSPKEMAKHIADCPDAHVAEYQTWAQLPPSPDFERLTGREPTEPEKYPTQHPNKFSPHKALLVGADTPEAYEAARQLAHDGVQVTAVMHNPNSPQGVALAQLPNVQVVPYSALQDEPEGTPGADDPMRPGGRINPQKKGLSKLMENTDHVILASSPTPQLPKMAADLAQAIKSFPPKQIVNLGVVDSDKLTDDPVSQWHNKAEKELQNVASVTGTPFTSLRGAPSMDAAAKQCRAMAELNPDAVGLCTGPAPVAWLDPRDMGRAVATCVTGHLPVKGKPRILDITGPVAVAGEDVAQAVGYLQEPEGSPGGDDALKPGGRPNPSSLPKRKLAGLAGSASGSASGYQAPPEGSLPPSDVGRPGGQHPDGSGPSPGNYDPSRPSAGGPPKKKSPALVEPTPEQLQEWLTKEGLPPEVAVATAKHASGWKRGIQANNDFATLTGVTPNSMADFMEDVPETFNPAEKVAVIGNDDPATLAAVKELVRSGKKVVACLADTNSATAQALKGITDVEVVQADPTQKLPKGALKGCKKVVWNPLDNPNLAEQAKNISAACKDEGVAHIVKVGCNDSNLRSNPISVWHDDAEKVLEEGGIPATFVRSAPPMSDILPSPGAPVTETRSVALPLGDKAVCFIDPRDVGFATARAILDDSTKGQVYSLTGPKAVTGEQVAEAVSQHTGVPVRYDDVPDTLAQEILEEGGVPNDLAQGVGKTWFDLKKGPKSARAALPNRDFERLTGVPPRSLDDFVAQEVTSFIKPPEHRLAQLAPEPSTATAAASPSEPKIPVKNMDDIPKDQASSTKRKFAPPARCDVKKSPEKGNHVDSEWDEFHAGGNHDFSTWRLNPQFKISVSEPMSVIITLIQPEVKNHIGWHVVRNTDPTYTIDVSPSHTVVVQTRNTKLKGQSHELAPSITGEARLDDPNATYFLVPSTFYQRKIAKFELDIQRVGFNYTDDDLDDGIVITRVKEPKQYNYTLDIRGDWLGNKNCPGGRSSARWRCNPQFKFTIPAECGKRTPAHVTVIISRSEQSIDVTEGEENDDETFKIDMVKDKLAGISLGVNLVKNRSVLFPDFVLPNHDILGHASDEWSHIQAAEVAVHHTIPVEEFGESFFVVPSTGSPGVELAFVCTVNSDTPITLRRVDVDEGEGCCVGGDPVNVPPPLKATTVEGEWTDATAGGRFQPSAPHKYRTNPLYRLETQSPTPQAISLILTQVVSKPEELKPMAIHCVRNAAPAMINALHANYKIIANSMARANCVYDTTHQVSCEVQISAQQPLLVVPSLFEPGVAGRYKITVLTTDPSAKLVKPTPQEEHVNRLQGQWKRGQSAGGRRKFASYLQNPQYFIQGQPGTNIQIVLHQKHPKQASLHVIRNSDEALARSSIMPGYEVVQELRESGSSETYFNRAELSLGVVLSDSDPLFVVPSLFEPNDENVFELQFISDKPVKVEEAKREASALPSFDGSWIKNKTDGGNLSLGTWRLNPQYRLQNSSSQPATILATLSKISGDAPLGLAVARNKPGDASRAAFLNLCVVPGYEIVGQFEREQDGKKFKYVKAESITLKSVVPPNSTVFLVPSSSNRGELAQFRLTLDLLSGDASQLNFQPAEVPYQVVVVDKLPDGIKGGGSSLINNPCYKLSNTTGQKTNVCCIFRPSPGIEYAYALSLVQNPADKAGEKKVVKGYATLGETKDIVDGEETEFLSDVEGGFTTTIEGKGDFLIVPRMTPVDEGETIDDFKEYTITVIADRPIALEKQK